MASRPNETNSTRLISTTRRPLSQQTSDSDERSLLNGSYSSLDDTSLGDSSSPSSPRQDEATSSLASLRLPSLPVPDPSISSDDDHIPVRATTSHKHATWARTFHSRPELWFQPQSVEEVQKVVRLARRCRRRVATTGFGHSPSDLTCTSSWMLNLDNMAAVLKVQKYDTKLSPSEKSSFSSTSPATQSSPSPRYAGRALVQAGISLENLNMEMSAYGLTLPTLGSIHVQSLAGAIATATHGSSLNHSILSSNVRGLRIVLSNGEARWCSAAEEEYPDLFRAALVSLGALGIITEIEIELGPSCNLEWETMTLPLHDALERWDRDLWTQGEFVRCWWMPYTKRLVVWSGSKTDQPCRKPDRGSSYGGWLGYHLYQAMLWIANRIPKLVPLVERIVMGMEHGSSPGRSNGGVDEKRTGLLMDCLYSQFVNEWAIPLRRGPEAIRRFEVWLLGSAEGSDIPFSNKGVYAHAPIEVRAGNGTLDENELGQPRAFLDQSLPEEPTLYLNATLYRPYCAAPPWKDRYYEAFEWLMKDMGGRPHWAKNFQDVKPEELEGMYGDGLGRWKAVREEVDRDGMFVGDWHRRTILGREEPKLALEEQVVGARHRWAGGIDWSGRQAMDRNPDEEAEERAMVESCLSGS